jgi:hypothetical protein
VTSGDSSSLDTPGGSWCGGAAAHANIAASLGARSGASYSPRPSQRLEPFATERIPNERNPSQ